MARVMCDNVISLKDQVGWIREKDQVKLQRVLHVDDDDDIRTIVQIALEVVGKLELKQCSDGPSALEAVRKARPDVILLDVVMPGMSGRDVWENMKNDPEIDEIPVVFVTAKAEDEFSEQLKSEGAMGVITKPFDPMTLANDLRDIWNAK